MFPKTLTRLALGILFPSLIAKANAQAQICRSNEPFVYFNSSKTVALPALNNNGPMLYDDPDETWYFSTRTVYKTPGADAMTTMWLNTGNSSMYDIGSCWQTTWTHGINGFTFSRDVLERSVDDKGDCKIMLGEECIAGLKRHYLDAAMRSASRASCDGDIFNATVPQECAGLVSGGSVWRGGLFGSEARLDYALNETMLEQEGCPNNSVAVNNSIHGGSGTGGSYNHAVRFPQPYFLTFWPNRTHDPRSAGMESDYVRVELLCLRTDDIEEGSPVPPSAQELLDAQGVEYAGNASNRSSGSGGGEDSTGGATAMKLMAPFLSAAAIAGLLLA
ncbi:hypothetical protein DPSP01_011231 [Paraphaeosphaeria sporulosa]|uniref:Uncharacterized protein n=1 Tax=Paraphaeosphaeria sporulosa TaxID=1460663 RepID=A0A177CN24_9PLEO|nr:uncharacterized protein CC84DRAFT_1162341 [Paraphaeosphaeria sporulosa]OAG08372.1 hypothetical protein CC84DRAFT_1162341 [Paraphaeosphaeria sporulosa]